jgi:hypothetical protein
VGFVPAEGGGELGQHELVLPADVACGLFGFAEVAEPHERGGPAAEYRQGVLAQVAEHQGQRHPAALARIGQAFQVRPGELIGPGDDHRRGRGGAA